MATVSCGGASVRYRFIERFGLGLGIKSVCAWSSVLRSGYYDWQKRVDSSRTCEDEVLKIEFRKVYSGVEGRYGSRESGRCYRIRGLLSVESAQLLDSGDGLDHTGYSSN